MGQNVLVKKTKFSKVKEAFVSLISLHFFYKYGTLQFRLTRQSLLEEKAKVTPKF